MNDTDTTPQFPIRLHDNYRDALRALPWLRSIGNAGKLASIDDVADVIHGLQQYLVPSGEEPVDDLYRLCVRVRDQYYRQFTY